MSIDDQSRNKLPRDANPWAAGGMASQPARGSVRSADPERMSDEVRSGLNGARWAMIIVGILTMGISAFMFVNSQNEIDQLLRDEGVNALDIDTRMLLTIVRVIYGLQACLGVVFIALGMFVFRFPILSPIIGLTLYILAAIAVAFLEPMSLVKGLIMKIIIVVLLIKAIRAGLAWRNERQSRQYH